MISCRRIIMSFELASSQFKRNSRTVAHLQKDTKFATLTIGKLRNNRNAESTFVPRLYEDKWFFSDIKEEFIRASLSVFYYVSGKN